MVQDIYIVQCLVHGTWRYIGVRNALFSACTKLWTVLESDWHAYYLLIYHSYHRPGNIRVVVSVSVLNPG